MNLELAMARGGISYRQYDHWNRKGILPWGNPGSGNPRPRDITDTEGALLITMGLLVGEGVAPSRAWILACDVARTGRANLGGLTVTAPAEAVA